MSESTRVVNPFPSMRRGLWRVKASPYLFKERWPEADFGNRWRAIKARVRACAAPLPGLAVAADGGGLS